MSLIAENQTVMGIRSLGERGLGTVTGHRGVRHVKGPFQYGVTGDNVDISAQECAFAIILLDAVRNLKWNAGRGEDVIASYPAGNAFVIPPHETIQFSWPLPVEYIYFPVSNRNKASHASEEGATGADAIPSKIIRFSSKQCLQVSQILWEELQSENSEDHFLQALHLVLTNVVIRNAVMAYDTGGVQPGLSLMPAGRLKPIFKKISGGRYPCRIWRRCWGYRRGILQPVFAKVLARRRTATF